MGDHADLNRLVARIQRELRAERERERAAGDPLAEELRRIRGEPRRGSVIFLLLATAMPALVVTAYCLLRP